MTGRIIITGASDGIGKGVALEMAARGYDLGLLARRQPLLKTLEETIKQRFPSVKVVTRVLDVTDFGAVEPTIRAVAGELGGLDILFANAGIASAGKVGEMPVADARRVIDTNVNGVISTIDAAVRIFREAGEGGQIVATSSVAAFVPLPGNAVYCASKAAVTMYLESARKELARKGITTTIVHPGFIDTEINRGLKQRPFLLSLEKGSRLIADAIVKKSPRPVIPRVPWAALMPLMKALPPGLLTR